MAKLLNGCQPTEKPLSHAEAKAGGWSEPTQALNTKTSQVPALLCVQGPAAPLPLTVVANAGLWRSPRGNQVVLNLRGAARQAAQKLSGHPDPNPPGDTCSQLGRLEAWRPSGKLHPTPGRTRPSQLGVQRPQQLSWESGDLSHEPHRGHHSPPQNLFSFSSNFRQNAALSLPGKPAHRGEALHAKKVVEG